MTLSEQIILDRITSLRRDNNKFWMRIVEIALMHAPAETKEVMREISRIDAAVNQSWQELSK